MTHAKCYVMRISSAVVLMILCGMLPLASLAQKVEQELPVVIAGKMPLYPIVARAARVQGVVKIRVTTDGKKVSAVDAECGPLMLVRAAKENILTWEFLKHRPTTFLTTFKYVIVGPDQCIYSNGASILNLPREVDISTKGLKTCDPATEIKTHQ